MAAPTSQGTKCAHASCQCQIAAGTGVQKDGKQYCSHDCANGQGCNHQNCHCGRS